ncbi:MAG: type IV secretion protein DotG [Legionella sp.]|nr:MAG: type IV secretion protein DotG [Legionella sp.]
MATKKENIKALFSNTRSRIIITFTILLVVTMMVIGFFKLYKPENPLKAESGVSRGPSGIRSIPGALNQTAQYAALQETQNVEQAKEAAAKGKSAIPTIIRSQAFGEGVESVGAQGGEGGVGFSTLSRQNLEGAQSTVWFQNLKDQHCNQESLAKAMDAGASLKDLKMACTCQQLKLKGFTLSELKQVCPCPELRSLGFSAKQFKDIGFCAADLKVCGFTACEERGAGFSADEMKNAGYSDGQLSGAGFSADAIAKAGGLPEGITLSDVQKSGCSVENLRRLRSSGVSAAAIRRISGCNAAALKAAGYSALDLKNAGFSAAELKSAGFTPEQLRQAGYSARELLDAGFSATDLANGGFAPADIAAAETILPQSLAPDDIRKAGCNAEALKRQRLAGVSAYMIKKISGCSASALKAAGFTFSDLQRAGFKPEQLTDQALMTGADTSGVSDGDVSKAGCDPAQLKLLHDKGVSAKRIHALSGCSAAALKAAGYGVSELANAGFTTADLTAGGFTPAEIQAAMLAKGTDTSGVSNSDVSKAGCDPAQLKLLHDKGVSAARIHALSGCSAAALKAAGYGVSQLANAGFTAAELAAGGFTPAEIQAAMLAKGADTSGVPDSDVSKAGCDPAQLKLLHDKGVSAARIHALSGCSAAALKAAGYGVSQLANAGFTAAELAAGGFTPVEIQAAMLAKGADASGVPDSDVSKAGCDPTQLKLLHDKGVSATRIHALSGCSAAALKAAGYSVSDLANAGFTSGELAAGGFTPAEIQAAMLAKGADVSGVPDGDIRKVGCDPAQLKVLHDKGVSAKRIHALNGCSAAALKAAGYGVSELAGAGFTSGELAAGGFTPAEIQAAMLAKGADVSGVPDNDISKAGCDPAQLKILHDKGVSAKRIHDLSGCSADALKKAGYGLADLANAGFTPAQLLAAGFTPTDLKAIGLALSPAGLIAAGRDAGCNVAALQAAHAMGMSAAAVKRSMGCSAAAMKAAGYTSTELKEAGFGAAELKAAGFSATELKDAGFSAKDLYAAGVSAAELKALGYDAAALKDAGFSAADLKAAGFSPYDLKTAGFTATELKNVGFTAADLKTAGYSAADMKTAGATAAELKAAGFSSQDLQAAGFTSQDSALAGLDGIAPPINSNSSDVPKLPSIAGGDSNSKNAQLQAENAKKLEKILAQQKLQQADQKFQQKVQQRTSVMLSTANQAIQGWKTAPKQSYLASNKEEKDATSAQEGGAMRMNSANAQAQGSEQTGNMTIKMGDVMFAVIDTSVNSDEPGPILATIVSGKLKGSKLIGTFNLPANAEKMVISFNSLSMPGAPKAISVAAFAIDPNTARTALSSETDHHYLSRYGALFASTFLEGFGNAFQSADTTITIGGTGGTQDTTVQNGIGRSALENAVIGLATVGKAWGQVAQQNMSRPTTVQVFSGTGIGVLFTQDLKIM